MSQDEEKRFQDTEKKSRELLSERAEGLLWDIDEIMDRKEDPESEKQTLETDEL